MLADQTGPRAGGYWTEFLHVRQASTAVRRSSPRSLKLPLLFAQCRRKRPALRDPNFHEICPCPPHDRERRRAARCLRARAPSAASPNSRKPTCGPTGAGRSNLPGSWNRYEGYAAPPRCHCLPGLRDAGPVRAAGDVLPAGRNTAVHRDRGGTQRTGRRGTRRCRAARSTGRCRPRLRRCAGPRPAARTRRHRHPRAAHEPR
jgi:hypothetical protein